MIEMIAYWVWISGVIYGCYKAPEWESKGKFEVDFLLVWMIAFWPIMLPCLKVCRMLDRGTDLLLPPPGEPPA